MMAGEEWRGPDPAPMTQQDVHHRFRVGHATAADWRVALKSCLRQLTPLPADTNLLFLYFSDHFAADAEALRAAVENETGIEACVGAAGMGVCATGVEYFDRPALAIMAGAFPAASFTLFERPDRCPSGWFGVVHADPRVPALPELLGDLAEASGAFLVGGLTASRHAQPQIAGKLAGGVSGVMFSDSVAVITGLTQGCTPIGPAHTVTACQGNVALALDGRPPFEVLREEAGNLPDDLRRLGEQITVALPVGGVDRADYLVRNLVGIDPGNGPIAIGEMLEEGQSLMFCRRGAGPAEADLDRMLADLRRRVGAGTPRGALYFACVARGPNMFGPGNREARRIDDAFGDLPLVGFYCAGEISNARLYGYTGVLSLFM